MIFGINLGGAFLIALISMFTVLFLILAVLGIIALYRFINAQAEAKMRNPYLEILRARYARGEINREEFEEKRKDLFEIR